MRWVFVSAVLFLGCEKICPRPEQLTGLDGGPSRCVQNTDCPRPSSVLVCGENLDEKRDCIACVESNCVRYHPDACP